MPKRLIVCCDGTWYSADKGADNLPSNVARLSRMIARHGTTASGEKIEQIVYYLTGVGTGHLNVLDSVTQGKFIPNSQCTRHPESISSTLIY
jgi:uncharacterized protein (DUF2235 family)